MKKILVVLLVLGLMVTAVGCGDNSEQKQSGDTSEQILIGNMQDMSGPTSVWGAAVTSGIEMAIEEINNLRY